MGRLFIFFFKVVFVIKKKLKLPKEKKRIHKKTKNIRETYFKKQETVIKIHKKGHFNCVKDKITTLLI